MTEDKATNKKELADIIKHERIFLDQKINFFTQTERELMVAENLEKLNSVFNDLSEKNKVLLEEIIKSVATLKVIAKELDNMLVTRGAIDYFRNGSQKMIKTAEHAKLYRATLDDLKDVVKFLIAVLKLENSTTEDELMDFISAKR